MVLDAPCHPLATGVLTRGALEFVRDLVREFRAPIAARLAERREWLMRWRGGEALDFLPGTRAVREGEWRCAPPPIELDDRRVEITGPVSAKMVINALNSGANVFMADFEDANSPTFANCIEGQWNLMGAVRRSLEYTAPESGKRYQLEPRTAVLFVRPRGLHLFESHLTVDGQPAPAALFDAGLYLYHNAAELLARGTAPYLYLPKQESYREARLWNQLLGWIERKLGLPDASVRVTCLIETLPAAFQMHEILYELRERSLGLNCGRWDYIFSCIKVWSEDRSRLLPDRSEIAMTQPFLAAYTRLLIQTCHRRGVHAMGGMAAQIPVKGDEGANARAFAKVRADKLREVHDGHDGTWVAHPALVAVAREVFDEHMPEPNQIGSAKQMDLVATAQHLLAAPTGPMTREGLAHNVRVGVQYLAAWLSGAGAVPLYDLMEDAATAEISRAQVWQMLRHNAVLSSGEMVHPEFVERVLAEELVRLRTELGEARWSALRFAEAERLFLEVATQTSLADFLTVPAYAVLLELERQAVS
ncbi:MAG: malate synthase A [Planctomycetaceae bacterium]|nr:malate synthase A [Planctomycetaceae bacterium]